MSDTTRPYGVLGRVLGHSYTPVIYRELAGLDYRKFEREPRELEAFVHSDEWEGFNVTIPYKRDLVPYMDELTGAAVRMGNINTVTRLADGRLRGDNTDYYGFKVLVKSLGLELAGKKAMVFGGSGGAGSTAMMVLGDLGMAPVSINREGEETYAHLDRHADAALAVNCTPVGMFPKCPAQPCTLDAFPQLEGLIDIVYNPARTALMMEAERRGIPCAGGLLMLVAQAAQAVKRYTGEVIPMERIIEVTERLSVTEQNVALIGMPGCGKTRVGEQLAQLLGREHVDIDRALEEELGTTCSAFIKSKGEEAFRERESEMLARVAARSGLVVSCGGGVVTRECNYQALHQNSRIVMLNRPITELSKKGRPITARDGLETLAERRMPLYRAWADMVVDSLDCAANTAHAVAAALPPMLQHHPGAQKGPVPNCTPPSDHAKGRTMKALVINGPNLNMLGIREPGIYGSDSYETLVQICQDSAEELGFSGVEVFQSNHEGAIVDRIQEAYGTIDGIVINPAAYTHTSVAILDALKAVAIPAVEVHISAVEEREDFRQVSFAGMACFARVTGEGLPGYAHALKLLAERLRR